MFQLTPNRLKTLAAATTMALAVLFTCTSAFAQDDIVNEIRALHTKGLEAYDFFEYDSAEETFNQAIDLAKANDIRDPIVAKVYMAKGILFHARFKDTAKEVADSKTFDEFVAAVSIDYDVELPEDYTTDDLVEILKKAREIVPPPKDGGNGGTGKVVSTGDLTITHDGVAVADACKDINITARVPAHPQAYRVYLHYRPADAPGYEQLELEPSSDDTELFVSQIPLAATASAGIDYYVEVVNRQGDSVASVGTRSQPNSITVIGECEIEGESSPIVHISALAGTGFGLANGDAERCTTTPDCYDDPDTAEVEPPDRFDGVREGMAQAPFHIRGELMFYLMKDLQLGIYARGEIIEPAIMLGAAVRYFVLADEPNRFYTGLGIGWGSAAFVVDLGPDFNNFKDIVKANGPVHLGLDVGYMYSFHENVGLQVSLFVPIHFPEFTFHFDLQIGPYVQF